MELEDGFCGSITDDMGKGVEVTSKTQEYEAFDAKDAFQCTNDNSAIEWK